MSIGVDHGAWLHANHLLHVKVGGGYASLRLECLPGHDHGSLTERKWPSDADCRCTDVACDCRVGDHGGCSEFGGIVEGIGGYECRCDRDDSECWTQAWLDEGGTDSLVGDGWPEDGPWPVRCYFDGDWMRIEYAP